MSDVLKNPIFCAHDSGEVVFTGTEGPLCGDCHAPMAWIAVSYIEAYSTVIDHQGAEIARLQHIIDRLEGR